jgi:hypothetical protein
LVIVSPAAKSDYVANRLTVDHKGAATLVLVLVPCVVPETVLWRRSPRSSDFIDVQT